MPAETFSTYAYVCFNKLVIAAGGYRCWWSGDQFVHELHWVCAPSKRLQIGQ
jgi:hypothetical protein